MVFCYHVYNFLYIVACHLQTMTDNYFFSNLDSFSFSSLITMARASKMCWIKVARVDILVLYLIWEEMMLALSLSYGLYYVELGSLCAHFRRLLVINGCFVKSFFCVCWDDYMVFIHQLLMWCITLVDLQMLKNPCILGINPTWLWCVILLICCCI